MSVKTKYAWDMVYACKKEPSNLLCGMSGYEPLSSQDTIQAWTEVGSCTGTLSPTDSSVFILLYEEGNVPIVADAVVATKVKTLGLIQAPADSSRILRAKDDRDLEGNIALVAEATEVKTLPADSGHLLRARDDKDQEGNVPIVADAVATEVKTLGLIQAPADSSRLLRAKDDKDLEVALVADAVATKVKTLGLIRAPADSGRLLRAKDDRDLEGTVPIVADAVVATEVKTLGLIQAPPDSSHLIRAKDDSDLDVNIALVAGAVSTEVKTLGRIRVAADSGRLLRAKDGNIALLADAVSTKVKTLGVTSDTIITTSDGTSLTNVLLDSTSSSGSVLLSVDGIAKKAGDDLVKADGDANNDDNEEEDGTLVGPPSYGNDFNVISANDDNTEEDDAIVGVAPVEVALVAGTNAKVSEFCFV